MKIQSAFRLVLLVSALAFLCTPSCASDLGPSKSSPVAPSALTDIQSLGKQIFFDSNLSSPAGMSCATCHSPAAGFTDPDSDLPVSEGVLAGRFFSRNAPSAAYAGFSPALYYDPVMRPGMMTGLWIGGFFWDGRSASLEEQAMAPFLNPLEMNNSDKGEVVSKIRVASYSGLFKQVYGQDSLDDAETAYDLAVEAIAEYERSGEVSSFTSKFDYSLAGMVNLTPEEQLGFELFTGKANCVRCHAIAPVSEADPVQTPYLFTNFAYQNIGVPRNPGNPFYAMPPGLNPDGSAYIDLGHGAVDGDSTEDGKFKIPSLRNVALTAPYMHNGVFTTIREVVVFDNTRDEAAANWPPPEVPKNVHRHMAMPDGSCMPNKFGCLKLSDQEIDDIVTFLGTLTDGYVLP